MSNKKSKIVAYILWIFLGLFGAHNFYTNTKIRGLIKLGFIIMFVTCAIINIMWLGLLSVFSLLILWIIDGVKLNKIINICNNGSDFIKKPVEEKINISSDMKEITNINNKTKISENKEDNNDNSMENISDEKNLTEEEKQKISKIFNDMAEQGKLNLEKFDKMFKENIEWFGNYEIFMGTIGLVLVLSDNGHFCIIGDPFNSVIEINEIKDIQLILDLESDMGGIIIYRLIVVYSDAKDKLEKFIDIPFDLCFDGISNDQKEKFEQVKSNVIRIKNNDDKYLENNSEDKELIEQEDISLDDDTDDILGQYFPEARQIKKKANEAIKLTDELQRKIDLKIKKEKTMEFFHNETENILKIEDIDERLLSTIALLETQYNWGMTNNNLDEESLLMIKQQLNKYKQLKEQRTGRKEIKKHSININQEKSMNTKDKTEEFLEKKRKGYYVSYGGIRVLGGVLPNSYSMGGLNIKYDFDPPRRTGSRGGIDIYQAKGNIQIFYRANDIQKLDKMQIIAK
jgi:TM2 domain-containing membrane protein YozV